MPGGWGMGGGATGTTVEIVPEMRKDGGRD